jgi:hypothetical protein
LLAPPPWRPRRRSSMWALAVVLSLRSISSPQILCRHSSRVP